MLSGRGVGRGKTKPLMSVTATETPVIKPKTMFITWSLGLESPNKGLSGVLL
jgi:hypothetical protein